MDNLHAVKRFEEGIPEPPPMKSNYLIQLEWIIPKIIKIIRITKKEKQKIKINPF